LGTRLVTFELCTAAHLPHGRVEVLVNLEPTLITMGSIAPGSNQTLPVLR